MWDNNSAYYLIPATDVRFRSSGASTLIVYEAIRYVQEKCISFDFEGSMSENIENSYKQFGTKQIPYHQIKKSYNFYRIFLYIVEFVFFICYNLNVFHKNTFF